MTEGPHDEELHMAMAIANFGGPAAAADALALIVRITRRDMEGAETDWRAGNAGDVARWVHRTRGALVLFGAPALRSLGEHLEECMATPDGAAVAYSTYRTALLAWLAKAELELENIRAGL